jgi:hypothetical protein
MIESSAINTLKLFLLSVLTMLGLREYSFYFFGLLTDTL